MKPPWRVVFARAAAQDLERLPAPGSARIARQVADLALDPLPAGSRKVVGTPYRRIRVADYRVLYGLDEGRGEVIIVRVARRSERTYRRLRG